MTDTSATTLDGFNSHMILLLILFHCLQNLNPLPFFMVKWSTLKTGTERCLTLIRFADEELNSNQNPWQISIYEHLASGCEVVFLF